MPRGAAISSRDPWLEIPFLEASYEYLRLWIGVPC